MSNLRRPNIDRMHKVNKAAIDELYPVRYIDGPVLDVRAPVDADLFFSGDASPWLTYVDKCSRCGSSLANCGHLEVTTRNNSLPRP